MQPGARLERRVLGVGHTAQAVGHGEGELVLLEQRLGLAPRPVLVVGVLLHVHGSQALRLVDERPLLRLGEQLPLGAQALADLRVVHLGVLLGHLAPLSPRPHHEGIHGPLDVVHRLGHAVALPRLQPAAAARAVALGPEEINVGCWRGPLRPAAPHFSPRRRSRRDEGAGGPAPGRVAPRGCSAVSGRPGARGRGERKTKSSPRQENFSAVSPPPRWQFALCFLCVLPVRWRPLANSPQVAATQQRGPPPRSFPC